MRGVSITLTCFMVVIGLGAGIVTAHQSVPDFAAMKQAYQEGRLSAVEYVELAIQALSDPTSSEDRWSARQRLQGFCLTPFIKDLERAAQSEPEAKAALVLLPTRPPKQASFISPDGLFTIHYDTTGINAVRYPDVDVDPADGVPDFVNRCAETFDHSWHVEVDTLGFDPPGSDFGLGGSDNYDIYMHMYPLEYCGWAQVDPGLAPPEYPERPGAVCTHIWVHPTFEDIELTEGFEPIELLETTAAHELFHAVEGAYDWFYTWGSWFEQSATWAMDFVYDDVDWYEAFLPFFFPYPHLYLYSNQPQYFWHGACVWPFFLEHRFGTDLIRQVWVECIPPEIDAAQAIEMVLQSMGSSHGNEVAEFRVWNYFTGDHDDERHYEEGADWPLVHIMAQHAEFPVINATPIQVPQGLACNYIEFSELDAIDHFRIAFTDENTTVRDWAVNFILWAPDTSQVVAMTIQKGEGEAILFTEEASAIVMVPTSVEDTWGHCHYSYSVWPNEYVVLEEFQTKDQGDGDVRLEAGETFSVGASFYSIGADWERAALTVSSNDPDLGVIQDQATGGSVSPGDTLEFPVGSILLSVANDLQEAHMATIELHVGPAGEEPLRTYEVDILLGIPSYLLVDDDGGDIIETYIEATLDSLGLLYDLWDDEAQEFPAIPIATLEFTDYDAAIIWIKGDTGNYLDQDDMNRIESILANEGHLLLSGQDIAESLSTSPEGIEFMEEWLGVQYDGLDTRVIVKEAIGNPLFVAMRFATAGYGADGADNQESRDRLIALADASACLEYDPTGYPAAISREWGSARLIFAGFGIEAIVDDNSSFDSRRDFLSRSVDWLVDGVDTDKSPIPDQLRITRIWPNPSSGVFVAQFAFPGTLNDMQVSLVDLAGRRIARLYTETPWNSSDTTVTFRIPDAVSNGIFLVCVADPETSQIIPVTIIR